MFAPAGQRLVKVTALLWWVLPILAMDSSEQRGSAMAHP